MFGAEATVYRILCKDCKVSQNVNKESQNSYKPTEIETKMFTSHGQ